MRNRLRMWLLRRVFGIRIRELGGGLVRVVIPARHARMLPRIEEDVKNSAWLSSKAVEVHRRSPRDVVMSSAKGRVEIRVERGRS